MWISLCGPIDAALVRRASHSLKTPARWLAIASIPPKGRSRITRGSPWQPRTNLVPVDLNTFNQLGPENMHCNALVQIYVLLQRGILTAHNGSSASLLLFLLKSAMESPSNWSSSSSSLACWQYCLTCSGRLQLKEQYVDKLHIGTTKDV